VAGAGVYSASGGELAISNQSAASLTRAAVAALKNEDTWSGIAAGASGARALAMARRADNYIVVAVFDSKALLDSVSGGRLLLVTQDGALLAAQPKPDKKTTTLADALGVDPNGAVATRSTFAETTAKGRLAVGSAAIATGGVRLYAAAPAGSAMAALQGVVTFYFLVFGAPLAAAILMLRLWVKQSRRAETAEAELVTTKATFRVAVDGARAGVFEWRLDTDHMDLAPRVAELLQAPSNEMRYDGFLALVALDDRERVEQAFTAARENGVLEAAFRVRSTSGTSWIEVRGLAIESDNSPDSLRVIGTAVDVTPQREAELRALALERRLREAIDSYSGPFALWDQRNRLVMWNRSYARAFNLPANLLRSGAAYDAIMAAAKKEIQASRQDPADPHMQEVELKTGIWLQMVERRTAEGGLVTVGADITALKRQEEALARSQRNLRSMVSQLEMSEGRNRELAKKYEEEKRRAEDASRAKSAFLANMSHELRTPLNAINGFSELMATELFGPLGDKRYAEYSRDILASGQLLLDLINDILDMAKIEAGKITLAPQPLEPLEAVDQAVRLMRRRADEKGLTLVVDGANTPEIEADHRAVKQMLLNLLSNAVKFTTDGGVVVRVRPAENGVTISVVDTGCGIPKEHLPRMGRAFEQVDMALSRKNGGTGLGLALTKSLVEMHGGRFELDSEEGRGTIATLFLPTRAKIAPEALAASAA
jgi:two-component system cell cycle sensor histidine kinase PleC